MPTAEEFLSATPHPNAEDFLSKSAPPVAPQQPQDRTTVAGTIRDVGRGMIKAIPDMAVSLGKLGPGIENATRAVLGQAPTGQTPYLKILNGIQSRVDAFAKDLLPKKPGEKGLSVKVLGQDVNVGELGGNVVAFGGVGSALGALNAGTTVVEDAAPVAMKLGTKALVYAKNAAFGSGALTMINTAGRIADAQTIDDVKKAIKGAPKDFAVNSIITAGFMAGHGAGEAFRKIGKKVGVGVTPEDIIQISKASEMQGPPPRAIHPDFEEKAEELPEGVTHDDIAAAMVNLGLASDLEHAAKVLGKGGLEASSLPIMVRGEMPRPVTGYDGPIDHAPSKGLIAGIRQVVAPVMNMPLDAQALHGQMMKAARLASYDMQVNANNFKRAMPDPAKREQATNYAHGLALDPKLPALTKEDMGLIDQYRKQVLDEHFKMSVENGVMTKEQYIDGYMSRKFQNQKKAQEFFSSRYRLAPKGGFSKHRIFEDTQAALDAGMKFVTKDFADQVHLYEAESYVTNVRAAFMNSIKQMPELAFPMKQGAKLKETGYTTVHDPNLSGWAVQKDTARVLDNMIDSSMWDQYSLARGAKTLKNRLTALAMAIPGFHQVTTLRSAMMTGYYRPGMIQKGMDLIASGDEEVRGMVGAGLILGTSQDLGGLHEQLQRENPEGIKKLSAKIDTQLWQRQMPGTKAFIARQFLTDLISKNPEMEREVAWKKASDAVNNIFGQKDFANTLGRNKTIYDTFKVLAFAPDFFESRLNLFANAVKETATGRIFRADGLQGRTMMAGILAPAIVAEVATAAMYKLAGKDMPTGKATTRRWGEMAIPFMKDSRGNPYMIDLVGYPRQAFEILQTLPKYVENHGSVFVKTLWEEYTNKDWKGAPIREPLKDWGDLSTMAHNVLHVAGHVTGQAMPIAFKYMTQDVMEGPRTVKKFAEAFGRDLFDAAGLHSRTDYPSWIRVRIEDQALWAAKAKRQIYQMRHPGDGPPDFSGAASLQNRVNDHAHALEEEIHDKGYGKFLGTWFDKNRSLMYASEAGAKMRSRRLR